MHANIPTAHQNIRIEWISLDLIDLHPLARSHSQDGLASLNKDMARQGQLQNIVVCPITPHPASGHPLPGGEGRGEAGIRYQVIAGAGRYQQAKALGWEKIHCGIREGLSEFQKLDLMLSENEEREVESPIHKGQVYQAMMDAEHLNAEELAKQLGMDRATMFRYLSLKDLPDAIKKSPRGDFLGIKHNVELLRLKTPEDQVELAEKCAQEEWSVKELTAEVDKKLGKPAKSGKKSTPGTLEPDPLTDIWEPLQVAAMATGIQWGVTYSHQPIPGMKGLSLPSWHFWVPHTGMTPKADLKRWFLQMADALGDPSQEQQQGDQAMARWMPQNEEEMQQFEASSGQIRLPETPEEQAELEKLSLQGPQGVYAWMQGPDSFLAKQMQGCTWQDLNEPDPITACRKLVDVMKKVNGFGQPAAALVQTRIKK